MKDQEEELAKTCSQMILFKILIKSIDMTVLINLEEDNWHPMRNQKEKGDSD
jgi:hypothetical protein